MNKPCATTTVKTSHLFYVVLNKEYVMYKEIEDSAYLVNNTKDLRKAFESYVDKNTLNVPHENGNYKRSERTYERGDD
jgi:hypothetical protein